MEKHLKEIHETAVKRAKEYNKATALLVAAVVDVERYRVYELFEKTYLSTYCRVHLQLEKSITDTLVRVVRKSNIVPELAEAVINQVISISNAKVIASVITPDNKDEWLKKAKLLSKENLEREVARSNGEDTKPITMNMKYEDYEMLIRAQDVMASKLGRVVSYEEAVSIAIDEYLDRHDPMRKAERWAEKCPQAPSLEHESNLRDECRCQHIYTDGTQCEERKFLHKHHIQYKRDGGADTLDNLITLCAAHHRMYHRNFD